jgi:hypothetical protein
MIATTFAPKKDGAVAPGVWRGCSRDHGAWRGRNCDNFFKFKTTLLSNGHTRWKRSMKNGALDLAFKFWRTSARRASPGH